LKEFSTLCIFEEMREKYSVQCNRPIIRSAISVVTDSHIQKNIRQHELRREERKWKAFAFQIREQLSKALSSFNNVEIRTWRHAK